MSITLKKHDGNQSLAIASLQVHYSVLLNPTLQCFKLVTVNNYPSFIREISIVISKERSKLVCNKKFVSFLSPY